MNNKKTNKREKKQKAPNLVSDLPTGGNEQISKLCVLIDSVSNKGSKS
jgi:hypothetical protein